jgi:hypothetical protein
METRLIKIMEITLPWPPSLNHYYRHVGPKVLISKEGRQYRRKVPKQLGNYENLTMYECPIELSMELYPPDNRKRDVAIASVNEITSPPVAASIPLTRESSVVADSALTVSALIPADGVGSIGANRVGSTVSAGEQYD